MDLGPFRSFLVAKPKQTADLSSFSSKHAGAHRIGNFSKLLEFDIEKKFEDCVPLGAKPEIFLEKPVYLVIQLVTINREVRTETEKAHKRFAG